MQIGGDCVIRCTKIYHAAVDKIQIVILLHTHRMLSSVVHKIILCFDRSYTPFVSKAMEFKEKYIPHELYIVYLFVRIDTIQINC